MTNKLGIFFYCLALLCCSDLIEATICGSIDCELPSDSCCNDKLNGLSCYDPTSYSCVSVGSEYLLCGSDANGHYQACGSSCYDSTQYQCCDSQIYSAGDSSSLCYQATTVVTSTASPSSVGSSTPTTAAPATCDPSSVLLLEELFTQLEPLFSNPLALQLTGEILTTFLAGLNFNNSSPAVLGEVQLITGFLQGLLQGAGESGGNVSVSSIPASALVEICQVIQGLSAPSSGSAGIDTLEYDIGNLLALLQDAVVNALTPGALFNPAALPNGYLSSNAPAAVRLALVPNGMVVSWQTSKALSGNFQPTVAYGTSARSLNKLATGNSHSYGTAIFHDVKLSGLKTATRYYYKILSVPTSKTSASRQAGAIRSFMTAPAVGAKVPVAITLVGDMGITNANDTYNAMTNLVQNTDVFIHIGDLSYADDYFLRPEVPEEDNYEGTWNTWQQWLQPITSAVPYMVLPGNHEAQCQELLPGEFCPPGQFNFSAYRNRFRMPSVESGAGQADSMWSSFDFGQVHVTLLNTETDFPNAPEGSGTTLSSGPFGGQAQTPALLDWLASDLKKAHANRAQVPWLVVMGHRPIYTSDTDPILFTAAIRAAFEALLIQYKVDLYISGHLHLYERLFPIANGVPQVYEDNVYLNPSSPVYIVNGAAGNDERHDTFPANSTISAVLDGSDFGYSRLLVHNATHFEAQFLRSADNSLVDDVWIVKHK